MPQWAENNLWPADPNMSPGMEGLRTAILLVLETGFCVGAIMAFLLNLILPDEIDQTGGDPTVHPIKVSVA